MHKNLNCNENIQKKQVFSLLEAWAWTETTPGELTMICQMFPLCISDLSPQPEVGCL